MPNCSQATCEGNNVITLQPRPCPQVQEPTCANGYPAVKVADEDGCCQHYQCQCEPRVGRGLAGAGPGWGRGGRGGTQAGRQKDRPTTALAPSALCSGRFRWERLMRGGTGDWETRSPAGRPA